jgi:hypothetical protein
MKTRALLSLLALLIAILPAACAPPAVKTADLDCSNTPDCRIQVSVNCFMTMFCSAAVDHDRVISRRNGKIDWEIVTTGYTFGSANGIVFATAPAVFQCHVEANGRRYSCANRGDRGEYKYTINLTGSPAVGALDPWVVNN